MKYLIRSSAGVLVAACLGLAPPPALASSHMDAPLITLDDAANTTDVYAFVSQFGGKMLTVALGVYPFEEPGIGPNKYNFDDSVLYEIHVAAGNDDVQAGRATYRYQFRFETRFRNPKTILQAYLGVIQDVGDANQNLIQTYTVTKVDNRSNTRTVLGTGVVPPNNQGNATPFYNQGDNGENPAKIGVPTLAELDRYTRQSITDLQGGYLAFAGQRDDGFYADVQAIFDLLKLRSPGKDSQAGFNIHTMVLNVPLTDIGGDQQVVGVWATTSRQQISILPRLGRQPPATLGPFIQVGRQGNPLFNEALVAIEDKDLYGRTSPASDSSLFRKYAETPELAKLLNALILDPDIPGIETGRTDISNIFIPDLIRVDLSTEPARLAGGGPAHPTNPDDPGFSRLSVFGGDVLFSPLKNAFMPGGWPNGRRFGDDVMDIAVSALISDLRVNPPVIRTGGDNVDQNDISYNKAFPYAATPLNGRTRGVNTGDRANTTTTLTSTPNASAFGQLVTFTATVNSSGGTPTGGDVIFREGANILATVPLGPFGQASIGISTLSVGSHNVTADYIGTASFSDSSSSTTHVVNKANTAITLNSGTNPSIATQSVGFTFNVTSTAGPLSGAVNIFRGTLQIGTAPFSNGVGTFSTSFTISGTYPIKVVYPGNATFNGSESNVVMQVVNPTGGTTP